MKKNGKWLGIYGSPITRPTLKMGIDVGYAENGLRPKKLRSTTSSHVATTATEAAAMMTVTSLQRTVAAMQKKAADTDSHLQDALNYYYDSLKREMYPFYGLSTHNPTIRKNLPA